MTTTMRTNAQTTAKQVVFTTTTSLACFLLLNVCLAITTIGYWAARTVDGVEPPMLVEAFGWCVILRKCYDYILHFFRADVCEFKEVVEEISKPNDNISTDYIDVASDVVREASDKVCPGLACNLLSKPKSYAATVVQTCKNRFGTPEDNRANRLAVRKFALDIMSSHRVRPTHINQVLDLCVEMVFVPNDMEQAAMALRQSLSYADRRCIGNPSSLARDMMRVITGKSGKHV